MENIFITLVCIALLIIGGVTIAASSFNSIDTLAYAWRDGEARAGDIRHTFLASVSSLIAAPGTQAEIVLRNDGGTDLAHFDRWDVIVKYQNGGVQWLRYTTGTPGWSVGGLYINGLPEIYEPNIFNPKETMKIIIKFASPVPSRTTNLVTIAAPNGVSAEITFGY